MTDPFLTAHWAAPRVYDISGKLSPVSIRDQMIRGRLFAERAFGEREITSAPGEGLVVVGAGAAGLTAAITAAELGVAALVLEVSPRVFRAQAACDTRWVDPTQYDWPLDHWTSGRFPLSVLAMPFPWAADWADQIASLWFSSLQQFLSTPAGSRLRVETSARLGPVGSTPGLATLNVAYLDAHQVAQTEACGALLLAVGFGTENVEAPPNYRGFAFWERDPFALPNWGVSGSAPPRVLISGGGDGALQDFLRIVTQKPSAREVFNACGLSASLPAQLKDLDRVVNHAYVWGRTARHDHDWHQLLDRQYRSAAQRELQQASVRQHLNALLANRPRETQLIHGCEHLTALYGLNRFLTLLIDEYLQQEHRLQVLVPKTQLAAVRSASLSHVCNKVPLGCHGQPHEVDMVSAPDCRTPAVAASRQTATREVIIVRHGITSASQALQNLTPLAHPRQILPYFML